MAKSNPAPSPLDSELKFSYILHDGSKKDSKHNSEVGGGEGAAKIL